MAERTERKRSDQRKESSHRGSASERSSSRSSRSSSSSHRSSSSSHRSSSSSRSSRGRRRSSSSYSNVSHDSAKPASSATTAGSVTPGSSGGSGSNSSRADGGSSTRRRTSGSSSGQITPSSSSRRGTPGSSSNRGTPGSSSNRGTSGSSSRRGTSGSSGSRRRSGSRSQRSPRGLRSKQGLLALFTGVCAIVLIWMLSGGLPKRDVVAWEGLGYREDESGVRGVRYSSFVNDAEYVFVITPGDLPEAEDYTITKPAALTVSEAVSLAHGALDKYLSIDEQSHWSMVHVALNHCAGAKWYYTVSFKPSAGSITDDGTVNELRIPVLMDGKVVEGILRPRVKGRGKELELAAQALGLTPEELLTRQRALADRARGSHAVTLISHVDPKAYKFEIPGEELSQQEDCDLTQPLLLAFHEAASAALQCSRPYLPAGQAMNWRLKELSLNRWGSSDKWYYLADFRLQGAEHGVVAPQLLIPILLDGREVQGQLLQ
ncbi:MAG: hypothetical protein PHO37_04865 [Kiritimatiellae bacterium]|nr:hypothetical protein [Kiritimatiellia bacterium]